MSRLPTFEEFLEKTHCSPLLDLVENKLAYFLRQWVDSDFGEVWDEKYDHTFYESARNSLLNNQECKNSQGEEFTIYNQALKHVALYLDWRKQKSGLGSTGRKHPQNPVPAQQVPPLTEGELKAMHAVRHERNPEARAQCLAHYRQTHNGRILCECCGFDFGKAYGELGEGFIEVHHLSPISQQAEAHVIDPIMDLVPLCANCHAMIHRVLSLKHVDEGMESLRQLRKMVSLEDMK